MSDSPKWKRLKRNQKCWNAKECACNRFISVSASIRPKQTGCGWGWKLGQARKTTRRKSWFDVGRQRGTRWISLKLLKETIKQVINRLLRLSSLCWLSWEGFRRRPVWWWAAVWLKSLWFIVNRSSHTCSEHRLFILLYRNANKNNQYAFKNKHWSF